jgi:predicted nucleotidyltransferase
MSEEKQTSSDAKMNSIFWDDYKLDPEIREGLLKIAGEFVEYLKVKVKPVDIIFTGSMANFNWSDSSDVDLHVIFDFSKINEDIEMVREYMMTKKKEWNDTFEITVKKYPVELYAQDKNEAHYSNGIFSVLENEWIVKPDITNKQDINDKEVQNKAAIFKADIDSAIKSDDLDSLSKIIKKLKLYRTSGLEEGGEYSIENLVFKSLRRDGTIEKMINAKIDLVNKKLSIKEYSKLNESLQDQKHIIIYGGRWSPFHIGHKEVYDKLADKFGKENIYISATDKVELPRSPFTFDEKKKIITTMFSDILPDHIIKVKVPYQSTEIKGKFPEDTVVIYVVGSKDSDRLTSGKYFKNLDDEENTTLDGYKKHGYYYVAPKNELKFKGEELSGTKIRELFSKSDTETKKNLFKELYGSFNQEIFDLFDNKIISESIMNSGELILEGGAYKHLNHFHDVKSNTFGNLKEFIADILQGKMNYIRLKTDGMNLMFTFIDGHLKGARNSSHIKNFGKNSLSIVDISQKFEGRDNIQKAFVAAMKDLQHAIGKLPKEQIDKLFDNGKNWMSVEVIHPDTENVIPYNNYELRFHGIRTYDEKGNIVEEDKNAADKLAKIIKDLKEDKQETYQIKSTESVNLPIIPDFKEQKAYFIRKVEALQKEYGMEDNNSFSDMLEIVFENIIRTHAKGARYAIPRQEMDGLKKRWGLGDKSFKVANMNAITNETFRDWVIDFDENDSKKILKQVSTKIELIILELGARVLKNLTSYMVNNPKKAVQEIKDKVEEVIRKINNTNDPKLLNSVRKELERLSAIGGFDAIVPEEGITFLWKGQFYKITGTFPPINKILNLRHQI